MGMIPFCNAILPASRVSCFFPSPLSLFRLPAGSCSFSSANTNGARSGPTGDHFPRIRIRHGTDTRSVIGRETIRWWLNPQASMTRPGLAPRAIRTATKCTLPSATSASIGHHPIQHHGRGHQSVYETDRRTGEDHEAAPGRADRGTPVRLVGRKRLHQENQEACRRPAYSIASRWNSPGSTKSRFVASALKQVRCEDYARDKKPVPTKLWKGIFRIGLDFPARRNSPLC